VDCQVRAARGGRRISTPRSCRGTGSVPSAGGLRRDRLAPRQHAGRCEQRDARAQRRRRPRAVVVPLPLSGERLHDARAPRIEPMNRSVRALIPSPLAGEGECEGDRPPMPHPNPHPLPSRRGGLLLPIWAGLWVGRSAWCDVLDEPESACLRKPGRIVGWSQNCAARLNSTRGSYCSVYGPVMNGRPVQRRQPMGARARHPDAGEVVVALSESATHTAPCRTRGQRFRSGPAGPSTRSAAARGCRSAIVAEKPCTQAAHAVEAASAERSLLMAAGR
jgi:hypothetical protein